MGRIWKSRWLLSAVLLFAVFVANVVVGKLAVLGGATAHPGLGDVGEFLVLFVSVVLFIIACLQREAVAPTARQDKTKEEGTGDA